MGWRGENKNPDKYSVRHLSNICLSRVTPISNRFNCFKVALPKKLRNLMATSAKQEQEGFWEELEKQFDRQIPIKDEVRYALDTIFKNLDVFDPEKREKVIDVAEHIAYVIVTAAFRGEDAEEIQKEVIKNMSAEDKQKVKEDKKKAIEERSQTSPRVATKHGAREDDITPGDFLEMFDGVNKLPKKYEQGEAP